MKNVYMFQPNHVLDVDGPSTYWLPYSVGCLWSYCSQFEDITSNFQVKDYIFYREDPDILLDRIENPSLCAFSCYIWNEQYCLEMAKRVKERYPECVIEFGGPQTTMKTLDYPFVDTIILSEGEESFLQILRSIIDNKPLEKVYHSQRIETLDFPSPYITGAFKKLVEENPDLNWAMTFETNRGCPHLCTFCDWGGVKYSKVKLFDIERVKQDLEWICENNVRYLICADANFGMYKERDLEIAKIIKDVSTRSKLESVNLQYSKNSTEHVFKIAEVVGDLNRGVTMSVQSMNPETLKEIKRINLSVNNIKKHIQLSEKYNVRTYTEFILGLPKETLETWKRGLCETVELGQKYSIDVHFLQLFGYAELNDPKSREKYGIETVIAEDYMSLTETKDYKGIKEKIEIVVKTNTMSTEDMVEGYLYGWMISQFHLGKLTQKISEYCLDKFNISYYEFYNNLYDLLNSDTTKLGNKIKDIKNIVFDYLKTGKLKSDSDGYLNLEYFISEYGDEINNIIEETIKKCFPNKKIAINKKQFFSKKSIKAPATVSVPYSIFFISL